MNFQGDFDALPLVAHFEIGPVPAYPTAEDFQASAMRASNADPFTQSGAAARWFCEAVRWRRGNPGVAMDLRAIAGKTAAALFNAQRAA